MKMCNQKKIIEICLSKFAFVVVYGPFTWTGNSGKNWTIIFAEDLNKVLIHYNTCCSKVLNLADAFLK